MGSEIRFSGGQMLQIDLELARLREITQEAMTRNLLLELEAPDGREVMVNPQQIQILQKHEGPPRS